MQMMDNVTGVVANLNGTASNGALDAMMHLIVALIVKQRTIGPIDLAAMKVSLIELSDFFLFELKHLAFIICDFFCLN